MKLRFRADHWLPKLLDVGAITLYPFVLFSQEVPSLVTIQHEWIHIRQVRRIGWLKFYASYLWFYAVKLVTLRNRDAAYRAIPYEAEAYANQDSTPLTDAEWKEMA